MNINILKCFISKLDFISERTKYEYSSISEINILNVDEEEHIIKGTVVIRLDAKCLEVITFETRFSQLDDILIFKSKYQIDTNNSHQNFDSVVDGEYISKVFEEVDTFVIINQESKTFFTPKTKYLIHLVDGNIKQAYVVNKKYKFENGLSENYTKLNMDNKELLNYIQKNYESQGKKK